MQRTTPGLNFVLLIAFVLLTLVATSIVFPVKREMAWVDSVSGSTKSQVVWAFGYDTEPLINRTTLADWIVKRDGQFEYDWHLVNGTSKTFWGQPRSFRHGRAPAVYSIQWPLMDEIVAHSTDEDLQDFVETIRNGTESEQHEAVLKAIDRLNEKD